MVLAMTLNLMLGGVDGRADPDFDAEAGGAIPAVGSSVLITAVTDSGGFFIFLGLATIFLVLSPGASWNKPGGTPLLATDSSRRRHERRTGERGFRLARK